MNIAKDKEGRWVGEDGFVVPQTTEEFVERFPDYAKVMAWSLLKNAPQEQREDLEQDIWQQLLHRRAVERFQPERVYGAEEKRFFHYLSRCCSNLNHTRWRDSQSEPAENGIAIDGDVESTASVTEEHVHATRLEAVVTMNLDDSLYIDGLCTYLVEEGHEDMVSLMSALMTEKNHSEAARTLGLHDRSIYHKVRTLRKLALEYERH